MECDGSIGGPFGPACSCPSPPQPKFTPPKVSTRQERDLGLRFEEAIVHFATEEGGCGCNGLLMAVQTELRALVAKTLDAKVHGGTLRKD